MPRSFDESVIRETAGRFLITLKNLYDLFALYADLAGRPPRRSGAGGAAARRTAGCSRGSRRSRREATALLDGLRRHGAPRAS